MKKIKETLDAFFRHSYSLENLRDEDQKQIHRSLEHQEVSGRTLNTLCNCQSFPVRNLDQNDLINVHQIT